MKLSNVKAIVGKAMTIGLVAGAMALIAPARAHAQQFAIGVQFGHPYPYDAYDARRDFYERERFEREREAMAQREAWARHEAHERHEAWERQERWEHARDFDRGEHARDFDRAPYGYDAQRGYYGR